MLGILSIFLLVICCDLFYSDIHMLSIFWLVSLYQSANMSCMYVLHTQPFFDHCGAQHQAIVWRLGGLSTTGRLYLIWT